MNGHKATLYVEGQAERIFVREMLLRLFDYDPSRIGYKCYDLLSNQLIESPNFQYGTRDSECFYQIINAGNDDQVIKRLKSCAKMHQSGFCVMGLRDMYSYKYREKLAAKGLGNVVALDLNAEFIKEANKVLDDALPPEMRGNTHLCFAIMEVEAWMIALLSHQDGVESIFHPAEAMKGIIQDYGKHQGQVESIMARLDKDSFLELYRSGRCPSFNTFLDLLIPEKYRNF